VNLEKIKKLKKQIKIKILIRKIGLASKVIVKMAT